MDMQNHKMVQPFLSHCRTKISLDSRKVLNDLSVTTFDVGITKISLIMVQISDKRSLCSCVRFLTYFVISLMPLTPAGRLTFSVSNCVRRLAVFKFPP